MIRTVTVAALLLSAAPTLSQEAPAPMSSMERYKALGLAAGPPTLTQRYGADDMRLGQLRLPQGTGPFPVAVVIHGGCWSSDFEDVRGTQAFAAALTARGIATWNIEYRMVGNPGGGWPGTFEDVAAGVDYLTVLAQTQPLDLSRVTLVGHSAGAHLAAFVASRAKLGPAWAPRVTPQSLFMIDGPAALAPFVGLDARVCGRPVIAPLMGGTPAERPEEYRLASPADHLPLGLRQYLVQGQFTPFMAPYAEAARASGDTVEVLQTDPNDHFDMMTPGQPNGDRTIDFIVEKAFAPN
jgi:acetyl esterase/lipase